MTTTSPPMLDDEYRDAIEELGLNQVSVANLLGFSPRLSRRYASGEFLPPTTVAALLRLMRQCSVSPGEVAS